MLSLHGDELAIPFDFIAPSLDVMLENLNNSLFYFINATPDSAQWIISLAIFIAKDVINIVPLLAVVLWLWGPRDRVCAQRQLIVKIGIALIISLAVSWTMGHLFPHDRPFVDHIGYNFLHHAADDSFPSDHGTVIFTFALAFFVLAPPLVRHRDDGDSHDHRLVARLSRVHWPLDMIGALLVAMLGCLSAQLIWQWYGAPLYQALQRCYRFCFALPIRKGGT